MAFILYQFADGTRQEIEVTEEFAKKYAEMEHKDALIERKETRRHQSLDKSLEHGFDIPDSTVDIAEMTERRELSDEIHKALDKLAYENKAFSIEESRSGGTRCIRCYPKSGASGYIGMTAKYLRISIRKSSQKNCLLS